MSIQILDGFQVNVAKPIDSRIVASGSVARNAIPYKYHGLRVIFQIIFHMFGMVLPGLVRILEVLLELDKLTM